MTLDNLHCPGCEGSPTGCTTCRPVTTYNPAQRCHCGSEMHASCGTGDHDTAADLELEALKADNAWLRAALETVLASAVPHPIEHPSMTQAWRIARDALRGGQ